MNLNNKYLTLIILHNKLLYVGNYYDMSYDIKNDSINFYNNNCFIE